MKTRASNSKVGIAVVTYNNLPVLEKCFSSWRANRSCQLAVFDNGSEAEVVNWLKRQSIDRLILAPRNCGLCFARNRLIEYFRDREAFDYVLLADSDVRFLDGMLEGMLNKIESDERIGIVGFSQANQGFPVGSDGVLEEIANECQLTRMDMWREIGLFPETLQYYSGDSWKSTVANMHGWRTAVLTEGNGYEHFKHGSHVNSDVPGAMVRDATLWRNKELHFLKYWRSRLLLGKGELHRVEIEHTDSDARVEEMMIDLPIDDVELLMPAKRPFTFTPQPAVETLVWLSKQVPGNILEVGCHEGLTTLQLAFNNPEKAIYAIDYTGDEPTLCSQQLMEQPTRQNFGLLVRGMRNVVLFDQRFDRFDMDRLNSVDLIFYDADLTYSRVKEYSEKVLEYFFRHPVRHHRYLVWHDYVPNRHRASHPDWLKLGEYVRRELASRYRIQFFQGTDLACLTYPGLFSKEATNDEQ